MYWANRCLVIASIHSIGRLYRVTSGWPHCVCQLLAILVDRGARFWRLVRLAR
ncbi:hypothetical protein BDW22DRAFT_1363683, partial [Trametopsis cervina]